MIEIIERSPITTHISEPEAIMNFLRYRSEYWKPGYYRMEKKDYYKQLVKQSCFLSGFQKRVFDYLNSRGLRYSFKKPDYNIHVHHKSWRLKGIVFRKDQKHALSEMIEALRGVWQAPTGSGKTLLICALVAAFPATSLIIVHTETLFRQTIEELERFFKVVGRIGCGEFREEEVSVGMIQTLSRKKLDGKKWGMVICDEVHRVSKFDGSYGTVLKAIKAPVRFGFTATPPTDERGVMAMEGLIGPVLGKTTYEELEKNGVLAKPSIRIYKVPEADRYKELKGGYKIIYERGIVESRSRNLLIVNKAKELIEEGLTVLIMVERISHGEILLKLCDIVMPREFVFLHGETLADIKKDEKTLFDKKTDQRKFRHGVIATRIWSEGVNIRSIGAVINAVGGDSEIAAIQRFGRGMRKTDEKETVHLIDFIDLNHKWFMKHSLKRICTYLEAGWELRGG